MQSGREKVSQRVENENVLRRKRALVAAFNIENTHERFAVVDRNTKHRASFGQNAVQLALHRVLNQRAPATAGTPPQNSHAQRNALAHGVRGRARFGFYLDFLGAVVEQSNADMIEAEVLLNLPHDLAEHLHWIVA